MKAKSLEDVIYYFDPQKPLNPEKKSEWRDFYIDTRRLEINRVETEFLNSPAGHKLLFGGHAGNGKSTELNKFIHQEEIRRRFAVIKFDVKDLLNPNDIEIVELLLVLCLQVLEFAQRESLEPEDYLKEEFDKLQGFFHETLKIESQELQAKTKEAGVQTEAGAGLKIPLVSLAAKFYARVKSQSDSRDTIRKEYRPRLTELIDLIKQLVQSLENRLKDKKFLVVIDGPDRVPFKLAEKLFLEDGPNIALIDNATMLLTVPISVIHSVKAPLIESTIGKIVTLKNIQLWNIKKEKEEGNWDLMKEVVKRRLDASLIGDEALDMAVQYSGGVFRTLIELVSAAAVESRTVDGSHIGSGDMVRAVNEQKRKLSRPLNRIHWDILLEIDRHRRFVTEIDETKLELLAGLFVLEYINDEEWYTVNPLIQDRLERYKETATPL
jgi:hypothetical protein